MFFFLSFSLHSSLHFTFWRQARACARSRFRSRHVASSKSSRLFGQEVEPSASPAEEPERERRDESQPGAFLLRRSLDLLRSLSRSLLRLALGRPGPCHSPLPAPSAASRRQLPGGGTRGARAFSSQAGEQRGDGRIARPPPLLPPPWPSRSRTPDLFPRDDGEVHFLSSPPRLLLRRSPLRRSSSGLRRSTRPSSP